MREKPTGWMIKATTDKGMASPPTYDKNKNLLEATSYQMCIVMSSMGLYVLRFMMHPIFGPAT